MTPSEPRYVFVNCPFDNEYFPLLRSLPFTLTYLGLEPLISETTDSGQVRLAKIAGLIERADFCIHDLSRVEVDANFGLPRFNMPFECGIDFGMRLADPERFGHKRLLILDTEQYRYQKFISDISGNDISAHGDDTDGVVKALRDWFRRCGLSVPGYRVVANALSEFEDDFENFTVGEGLPLGELTALTFTEIIELMQRWVSEYGERVGD